jgi:transcriptional regulator with XRE-family HTH domain
MRTILRVLDIDKLKALRLARGWDQAEAARRAGLGNKARWSDIESGRRKNVTMGTLDAIAKAFGVKPQELIK